MSGITGWVRDRFDVPDERHIERVGRSVAQFDLWRWSLLTLYVIDLFVLIGGCVGMLHVVDWRLQRRMWDSSGFVVGFLFGAGLGLSAFNLGHGVAQALIGLRTERLMIRYHDALMELEQGQRLG